MPRFCLFVLVFSYMGSCWADVIMWLPKSYEDKDRHLSMAVDVVMDTERCHQALKATISIDQSTLAHPIYKVLCRDESQTTYYELVDGLDLKIIVPVVIIEPDDGPSVEELEQARNDNMWRTCEAMLQEQYRNYPEVDVLTKKRPKEQLTSDGSVLFTVDFDAVSIFGKRLRYRAICSFNSEKDYNIRLRPRPSL